MGRLGSVELQDGVAVPLVEMEGCARRWMQRFSIWSAVWKVPWWSSGTVWTSRVAGSTLAEFLLGGLGCALS